MNDRMNDRMNEQISKGNNPLHVEAGTDKSEQNWALQYEVYLD